METWRPVLLLALASATLALAAPPGWDPAEPARSWRPGERRRLVATESVELAHTRRVEGAEPRASSRKVELEASLLLTVAEVSSAGAVVAWRVDVERWSRVAGGPADTCLAGRAGGLRLDDVDDAGGLELEPSTPEPSPAGRAWLTRLAGWLRAPAALDRALAPPRAVSQGEAWDAPEVEQLVEGHPFTRLDAARSRARVTLVQAGPDGLLAKLEARLQTTTIPGTAARVAEGGVYALDLTARWPRGDRPALGRWREAVRYDATGRDQLPDGTPCQLEVKVAIERAATVDEAR